MDLDPIAERAVVISQRARVVRHEFGENERRRRIYADSEKHDAVNDPKDLSPVPHFDATPESMTNILAVHARGQITDDAGLYKLEYGRSLDDSPRFVRMLDNTRVSFTRHRQCFVSSQ
jgi:hypothetical protein